MRLAFSLVLLAGSAALAQEPKEPAEAPPPVTRFGVPPKLKTYPQETAKKALASAIEAVEKGDGAYLVAHLLDPGFVELRLADRAKQFEAAAEADLARLRDLQIRNPDKYLPEDRVPADKVRFRALIVERSREAAFKQLVRDVSDKLLDDPQVLRDLKKFFQQGMVTDTETGAKFTHDSVKDRALFLRKIGDRWFLENRQEDAAAPAEPPKKEPEKKGM